MAEWPTTPPPAPEWPTPTTESMPPKKRDKRPWAVGGVAVAVVVLIGLAAAAGGGTKDADAAPSAEAVAAVVTPEPTPEPTPTPTATPEPTPEPTLDPNRPITLEELAAAVAAKDCAAIMAISSTERIEATDDTDVMIAGIEAVGHCLDGEWDEGLSSSDPLPIGQSAVADDGIWRVKVTGKANFDAWKLVKRENMFNDPAPSGMKMVMIPLSFTNVSDETQDLLGLGEYVIGDATLIEVRDYDDPNCGVIPKEIDFFRNVRPGGVLKGNMCFVVDKADIPTLRFGVPVGMFSIDDDIEFALR